MSLGWKMVLELGRQEKKSKQEDDDRVKTIMDFVLEKASKACFDASKKRSSSAIAFLV
jgi:hypothetical protein